MKKNLKKVISAVLALTLVLSSFVSLNVSAATFADVADTASYAEAVNVLAALGAIEGYGDGTFQPNNEITRAETATMLVAALNLKQDAIDAGSTCQFDDVNKSAAWAAGYVNVGVSEGYISGMTKKTFEPQSNVTFHQMLVMLTRILGYADFAESRGGWEGEGYIQAATTAGIKAGVAVDKDANLTRAQVAQLIWNTLRAPKLDITTFVDGEEGTESQKMDGKGNKEFMTPLSENFNAYVLNVEVTETSKTLQSSNGPEISMKLTNNNDWDPDTEQLVKYNTVAQLTKDEVDVGKTAAEDYLFSSAKVVASYINDDWKLIYFAPTTKVAQKEVEGELRSSITGELNAAGELKIKKSKKTTNTTTYKLSPSTDVYVNGVYYAKVETATHADILKLLGSSVGKTVLVEDSQNSGYYNKIMIDYAVLARVNQVVAKSDYTKVSLANMKTPGNVVTTAAAGTVFQVNVDDVEDGTKTLTVAKNGEAIELSALAKDDVVAIKYNLGGTIEQSAFIDVVATTDVVTGKFYSYDPEDQLYTISDGEYKSLINNLNTVLENGTTYTFKLDPYGRLFDYDVEAVSKNFAIVERYVPAGAGAENDYLQVVTMDGTSKTLYIEATYEATAATILNDLGIYQTVKDTAANVAIQDRVIEYSVKASNGKVREIKPSWTNAAAWNAAPVGNKPAKTYDFDVSVETGVEYNSKTGKLGGTLADDVIVLDATKYAEKAPLNTAAIGDYKAATLESLTDGVEYDAVLVYKSNTKYCYAIVTSAGATFGADSDFAVAAADFTTTSRAIVNDDEVYTLPVLENGASEAEKLNIAMNAKVYLNGSQVANTTIKAGSVFFYTKDADGFVDKISVVYDGPTNYASLLNTDTQTALGEIYLPFFNGNSNQTKAFRYSDWKVTLDDDQLPAAAEDEIQLVIAPVVTLSGNNVSIAEIKKSGTDPYIDTNVTYDYAVASDANIYSYDMSGNKTGTLAFSAGALSDIDVREADSNGYAWLCAHGTDYDFSAVAQVAVMMIVNGAVTNALVFSN